ncbi:MAG: molybdopterin molybdotransferase MoeA [Thalassobaculales bacterium]
MAQLTDDCFAFGAPLVPIEQALDMVSARLEPVAAVERQPLAACLNRFLAADVVAERDVPPADNSAVDGYAVRFDDLAAGADSVLAVGGRVAAGHPLGRPARPGEAIRIFTGAPMPEGCDTVMMQEDCEEADGRVRLRPGIRRGANRRKAGEDVAAGAVFLSAGRRLRPQDLGLCAAQGITHLPVRRPLAVAIFSTGDELREPGTALPPGAIYDANRTVLAALLTGLGCEVSDLGILPDRREAIAGALAEAAARADLIVTSGGMSTGEEDHVKAAVEAQGRLHVWRLAIKPGRPVAVGQVGAVPFLGLPGNPAAVMVTFLKVARPIVLRLAGAAEPEPVLYAVRAGFDYRKKPDRREYVRCRLQRDGDGALVAHKFPRDGAGLLSSLIGSDGLVELAEPLTRLEPGTMVPFLPFSEVRL